MAIGPNVVDDCEGMTEEEYWRGMDEAMQDEEGDEPFCTCSTGHGIEETDWNQCDSCGKPIYDEEPAVPLDLPVRRVAEAEEDRMTMTQRYAGMLRRQASEWDKQAMPVQAECARQAARHMEELQDKADAVQSPWQPMKTAPKDGSAVLVLLESSGVPKAVEWCEPGHFLASDGAGWYMTWDGTKIQPHDGPRYWMHCPDDPDDGEPEDA